MELTEVLRDLSVRKVNSSESNETLTVLEVPLEDLNYFTLHPVLTYCYLTVMSVSTLVGLVGNILVSSIMVYHT